MGGLRILHILDHSIPLHSGYSFRTLSILREQRKRGWQTFHLTTPKHVDARADEEEVDGWHFYRTRDTYPGRGTPFVGELMLMREVERRVEEVVRRVGPDVLHAHSPVLNAIPALRVGRRLRLPVVYEVRAFWEDAAVDHGTTREGSLRYRATRALETYAMTRADHVTVICDGLRADIVSRGIPPSKITVIPNAVDTESFSPRGEVDRALKATLGLDGAAVIGFIGSFYAYEGLDLLVDALPAVVARMPQARVLLVGGGPQEAALRERARASGVADKVVFTGRVPHGDVQRYYDLVDVLAYPRHSIRLTELVTPLKPLEAMAQGRLLVASDVGGHRELIRNGETGVLFRAGSAGSLADALVGLLGAHERWASMRSAGRSFVEHERTWTSSVERYADVYAALTAARRAALAA
jgi:PEP-CTERM/exosortase A-associated glycosyltransferase